MYIPDLKICNKNKKTGSGVKYYSRIRYVDEKRETDRKRGREGGEGGRERRRKTGAATFAIHNRMREISLSGMRNIHVREYGIQALAGLWSHGFSCRRAGARLSAPVRPIVSITVRRCRH